MQVKIPECLTSVRRVGSRERLCARRAEPGIQMYCQPVSPNPNSAQQQLVRASMKASAEIWRAMTSHDHDAWAEAAARLALQFRLARAFFSGYMLFSHCARNRQLLGLDVPQSPPALTRPPAITSIILMPDEDPRSFAFRIGHHITKQWCANCRLLVHLTAPGASPVRRPDIRQRRLICGFGPASAVDLLRSGQIVRFPQAQIAVPAGNRFGLWFRVIHVPDGIASEEVFFDVVRPGVRLGAELRPTAAAQSNSQQEQENTI